MPALPAHDAFQSANIELAEALGLDPQNVGLPDAGFFTIHEGRMIYTEIERSGIDTIRRPRVTDVPTDVADRYQAAIHAIMVGS